MCLQNILEAFLPFFSSTCMQIKIKKITKAPKNKNKNLSKLTYKHKEHGFISMSIVQLLIYLE